MRSCTLSLSPSLSLCVLLVGGGRGGGQLSSSPLHSLLLLRARLASDRQNDPSAIFPLTAVPGPNTTGATHRVEPKTAAEPPLTGSYTTRPVVINSTTKDNEKIRF